MTLGELQGTCQLPAPQATSRPCLWVSSPGPQAGPPPLGTLLPAVAQAGARHPAASLLTPNLLQSRCGFTQGKCHLSSFSNRGPTLPAFTFLIMFFIKAQLALLSSSRSPEHRGSSGRSIPAGSLHCWVFPQNSSH